MPTNCDKYSWGTVCIPHQLVKNARGSASAVSILQRIVNHCRGLVGAVTKPLPWFTRLCEILTALAEPLPFELRKLHLKSSTWFCKHLWGSNCACTPSTRQCPTPNLYRALPFSSCCGMLRGNCTCTIPTRLHDPLWEMNCTFRPYNSFTRVCSLLLPNV